MLRAALLFPLCAPLSRASFGCSYAILAYAAYCLYQHYRSYTLLRVVWLRAATAKPAGVCLRAV